MSIESEVVQDVSTPEVEVSETVTPETAAPEAPEVSEEPEEDHPGAKDDAEEAAKLAAAKKDPEVVDAKPVFVADYKVKAYGKTYEIPEKFRSLMTDDASSKEVRDVFEKSFALDDYKPKQEAIRQKVEHYEQKVLPQYAKQDAVINELIHYAKTRDFDSYFEAIGIPEAEVMKWMERKLSFTPEQLALYNQNRELQKGLYKQSIENTQLKTGAEQMISDSQRQQAEGLIQQLDYTLGKSDYAERAKLYDQANGENSFRNLVIKHGHYAAQVEKRNLSNDEAIKEVLERVAPAKAPLVQSPNPKLAAPKELPVLPVVRSRPVSPTAKLPRSIDDIRKKSEQMGAANFDE